MIIKEYNFNSELVAKSKNEDFIDYPVVYMLINNTNIYVGETANFQRRMKDHLKNKKRKNMKYVKLIISEEFNKSATFNIETNLINYLIADEKYKLTNVSQTRNKNMHNYYDKEYYNNELFNEIWQKLYEENFVNNKISTIKNKDIFKLSPYKELTFKQNELENNILEFCKKSINLSESEKSVFVVQGDAGSGKSVLISSLYNTIQDLSVDNSSILNGKNNFLLVNHEEVLKTYSKLAKVLPNVKMKNILKPTSFINKNEISDITIVDEAHLLLSSSDKYNNFNQKNHLEEIIKKSKIVILMFDDKQFLKLKSYWNINDIQELLNSYSNNVVFEKLTTQLRMKDSVNTQKWIDNFVEGNIVDVEKDKNYDFKIFSTLKEMHKEIKKKNDEFELCRVVSTFDYEHKKDLKTYYVEEQGYKLPWNTKDGKKNWAERDTVDEVGSIYTIQGFDLNYVGVVIGPSIYFDEEKNKIAVDISKYKDTEAFRIPERMRNFEDINVIKEQIILNSLNVLMKRGIKGLYIYVSDEKLRSMLLKEGE